MKHWLQIFRVSVCLCGILGFLRPINSAELQRIAGVSGPAPGIPGQPGANHFTLQPPVLNNHGQVAFHSFLDPTTLSGGNSETVWGGSATLPQLIARVGNSAPGTTQQFESFGLDPLINNAGQLLINARVTGNFDQSNGLWLGTAGNLQLVARTNVAVSGSPYMIDDIDASSVAVSDNGKVAFTGSASNNKSALWYGSPGNLAVVAMEDSPVPTGAGLPAGSYFLPFLPPSESPVLNSSGKLAFAATITNTSGSVYGRTIWTGTPGNLQLLVRENTSAPGVPGEEFFLIDTEPVINNSGQIAFGAHLTNFNDSIWLGTPGNLQMVLEGNDPAPVGTAGVRFADFGTYDQLRLSDSGHILFRGQLEGTGVNFNNDHGLFRATVDGVDMVTRMGRQAPGLPTGAVFQDFTDYSINATGQIAFMGAVTGGGVPLAESTGIWAQNADNELELVVKVGDWVHPLTGDLVPAAQATNTSLLQSQGYDEVFLLEFRSAFTLESEFGTAWNSEHQLAFQIHFANPSNGSSLFLADLGSMPGDFDNDGDIDGRDFLAWQRVDKTPAGLTAWQASYNDSNLNVFAAIPEPTALLLAACGVALLIQGRHFVR